MTTDPAGTPDHETARLAEALAIAVAPSLGFDAVRVEGLHRLSGGASRETWGFEAVEVVEIVEIVEDERTADPVEDATPERHRLIFQRTRPGPALTGPSMATEDRLLAAAIEAGVPVPPVVVDAATAAGRLGEGRVTRHVDGETLGPRIVRHERYVTARSALTDQCARALAAIHSIDPMAVGGLETVEPLQRLRVGFDQMDEHRPTFELALRWLDAHRPPPSVLAVVHGDFRLGNLIVDESGLRAVLDWELAHLGDPLEDLGWLCVRSWRFGGAGEVAGVGRLEELIAAYAAARGEPVDPEAVRWWIAVGTLTWGLICAVQARRHLDGHVRSVELATIGRRVCETEYDLLGLLGIDATEPTDAPSAPPKYAASNGDDAGSAAAPRDLHGRPTAAELVDAVRGHLEDLGQPGGDRTNAFQTKVAGNALAMVERELRLGPAMMIAHQDRLRTLGYHQEAALADAIRTAPAHTRGPADRADVRAAICASVVDRLRVANPRWLLGTDRDQC
ncbi:MAG: phosphotransferase family protein [Aquihabitans sp.]